MAALTPLALVRAGLLTGLAVASGCGGGGGGDSPPVFKVTPVNMVGPYMPGTMTYGSVRFEGPVLIAFGADLGTRDSPAIEYITTPTATVRACCAGRVDAVEFDDSALDYEIRMTAGGGSRWLAVYDHVKNVTVGVGDDVVAGQSLGTAGNWSATAGRTELQINDQDSDLAHCPLDFGDASFVSLHEALRQVVHASPFGPLPTLCIVDTVPP